MRAFAAEGRTILFATHYLEEADQVADRIVVLDRGRIVADGPADAIKAGARNRTIRFRLGAARIRAILAACRASVRRHRGRPGRPRDDRLGRDRAGAAPVATSTSTTSRSPAPDLETAFLALVGRDR